MTSGPCFLGVDLGGTQMRMAAVTQEGRLATEVLSVPTGRDFGPDDLQRSLRTLREGVRSALNGQAIVALGFGTAGVVDRGPLTQCNNLPRLNGTDLGRLLRQAIEVPVTLENDARCFTLAEARYGAGRGAPDVCGITVGTGVGCGVMVGGRLHRGAAAQAGEVYQIPLRGQSLEYFVSGAGVVRGYQAAGGTPKEGLDGEAVAKLARAGDPAAAAAWRGFGEDLAILCAAVIALLDPAVIVIGGSLSGARDLWGARLSSCLEGYPTRIAEAELGRAAGVIGAAALNMA